MKDEHLLMRMSEYDTKRNDIKEKVQEGKPLKRKTILIADDAVINRELLKDIFEEQYEILEAANGEEAITQLIKHADVIRLVLLDLMMPVKDGLEVLKFMARAGFIEKIPVIMITGESTVESDMTAYDLGATDIIYKPFEPQIVIRRAKNTMELYEHRIFMEKELEKRTQALVESQDKLAKSNDFLINALSSVVEFRSLESGEHIQRVKYFTGILLRYLRKYYPEYGFSDEQIALITQASALHDLGKIAIPDNILLKPGKLTFEEFEEMKKHTTYGCELLENFVQDENEFYRYCYDICRHHHERYDGRGYPDNLEGEDIPIWAQVVSIVDVYDALVSKRVYKDAYAGDEAVRMIHAGECGTFSPKIIDCFDRAKRDLFKATNKKGVFADIKKKKSV